MVLYLGIKFLPSQNLKNLSQMLLVDSLISAADHNIINVNHNKVTNEGFKDLIHQSHDSTRGLTNQMTLKGILITLAVS